MTETMTAVFDRDSESAREAEQVQASRAELVERILRVIQTDGSAEPVRGLKLNRVSAPNEPLHTVYEPVFCVIAQGSKEVFLDDERYVYDPNHYLLVTADLPVVAHVLEASEEQPYLSLRLELDPTLVGSVMVEAGYAASPSQADARAINVSSLDAGLLDAVVRLVRLADSPKEARYLAPLATREIVYRLLTGKQGDRLRYATLLDGHAHRIAMAIEWIRDEIDRPLSIADMAQRLGMSVSGFHQHFKAVSGLSPLQYQKQLRLHEARRLMLGEQLDAASAGYRVGYGDASHFSREYKRLFGLPPMRDIYRMREGTKESAGLRSS